MEGVAAATEASSNGHGTPAGPKGAEEQAKGIVIVLTVNENKAALSDCIKIFEKHEVRLEHIESRSEKAATQLEYIVKVAADSANVNTVFEELAQLAVKLQMNDVPWLPKRIEDLDLFADRIVDECAELETNHPTFQDQDYVKRKKEIIDIALQYKHGNPIPRVDYTEEETKTWGVLFTALTKLYPTHACQEYNEVFPLLIQNCQYRQDNIPQLQDISEFLKERTGFTLRPVAGFLSPRDFLAGLAFRVFYSTQYIRHSSTPLFALEPDVCHELLGHVPLFANSSFAQFSQEIGLASLGASQDYIEKLSALYRFTVEFGLCRQNGKLKAFGAGILSSSGELEYCLSGKPTIKEFVPEEAIVEPFPLTKYQPTYFVANSFEDAKRELRWQAASEQLHFVAEELINRNHGEVSL